MQTSVSRAYQLSAVDTPLFERLFNYILYQLGWFACVVGAATSHQELGVVIAVLLVLVHLLLTNVPLEQLGSLVFIALLGLIVDTLLLKINVYEFPSHTNHNGLPPLWMTMLWIQFATTFRYCLKWMSGRYVLSALFGLVGAPLTFIAGEGFGAVAFTEPRVPNMMLLGAVWAVAIPVAIWICDRIHSKQTDHERYRVPRTLVTFQNP